MRQEVVPDAVMGSGALFRAVHQRENSVSSIGIVDQWNVDELQVPTIGFTKQEIGA